MIINGKSIFSSLTRVKRNKHTLVLSSSGCENNLVHRENMATGEMMEFIYSVLRAELMSSQEQERLTAAMMKFDLL